MSASLTPAPMGPCHPSCVGGGRPPQHNVPVTPRLRSEVQMCNETNTRDFFLLWVRVKMESVPLVSPRARLEGGVARGWDASQLRAFSLEGVMMKSLRLKMHQV